MDQRIAAGAKNVRRQGARSILAHDISGIRALGGRHGKCAAEIKVRNQSVSVHDGAKVIPPQAEVQGQARRNPEVVLEERRDVLIAIVAGEISGEVECRGNMAVGRSILRATLPQEKARKIEKDHFGMLLRVVERQTADPLDLDPKLHEVAPANVGDGIGEAEIIRRDSLGRVRTHPYRKLAEYFHERKRGDARSGRDARIGSRHRVVDPCGACQPGIA